MREFRKAEILFAPKCDTRGLKWCTGNMQQGKGEPEVCLEEKRESMEKRTIKIAAKSNKKINLKVIPGHFATSQSHINYYLDMTSVKVRHTEAREVAKELVKKYSTSKVVDAIICMDGCEVIGAYLADELTNAGIMSMNSHHCVNVVTPEIRSDGQMILRDNLQSMVMDKHVVILLAIITTGKTIKRCIEGIRYYGGVIEGIDAIFSNIDKVENTEIHSLFGKEDISDYQTYAYADCPYCKSQRKLDAMVNGYGYSRI